VQDAFLAEEGSVMSVSVENRCLLVSTLVILTAFFSGSSASERAPAYPIHKNITVTVFWAGEGSSKDNQYISNEQSVWDSNWVESYGGVDDPDHREGYSPTGTVPRENPFYFALPYNDFDSNGKRKPTAYKDVYWASRKKFWGGQESMCKNRWIAIRKGRKVAYAQWEDAGPFGVDDVAYVFGSSVPKNKVNKRAGLDVSPAVRDYLKLSDIDVVAWRFVEFSEVPDGPWKEVVTTTQINRRATRQGGS